MFLIAAFVFIIAVAVLIGEYEQFLRRTPESVRFYRYLWRLTLILVCFSSFGVAMLELGRFIK